MARRERRRGKRAGVWTGGGALLLALAWALLGPEGISLPEPGAGRAAPPPATAPHPDTGARDAGARFDELFRQRRSGVVIEAGGEVTRVLPDDLEGSRHQRFILDVGAERTLLVSHNIDLAPRIPELRRGDRVDFRGQYEWNERGGVVHWTHHDPGRRRPGGWLRHGGSTYR